MSENLVLKPLGARCAVLVPESRAELERSEPIPLDKWKPHPEPEKAALGYVVRDHWRPIANILHELNQRLRADGLAQEFEYGFDDWREERGALWPDHRWIACYAVTGGSEGHYIHIDCILEAGRTEEELGIEPRFDKGTSPALEPMRRVRSIALAKTFGGWEVACRIAAAAGRHLGA